VSHSEFIDHWTSINQSINSIRTHPFNGSLSGTTRVSRYQKGKTNLDLTEARDSEWPWHQMGHMQICTSLQTEKHASTHHSVSTGRMPFLPPNQQRQSTEGNQFHTHAKNQVKRHAVQKLKWRQTDGRDQSHYLPR